MNEPQRHKLPETRAGLTTRVAHTGELDLYITVGFFPDGQLGEVFIKIGKEGSTLGGVVDIIAVQMSVMLQYGIPWARIARKLRHTKFEPLNAKGHSLGHVITQTVDKLIQARRNAES